MTPKKSAESSTQKENDRSRVARTAGAYLLSLELENVRCFSEKQTLDLSDGQSRPAQWTILIGENGTGKTTILQSLVALHQGFRSGEQRLSAETWARGQGQENYNVSDLFKLIRNADFDAIIGVGAICSAGLSAAGNRDHGAFQLSVKSRSIELRGNPRSVLASLACFAYGAGRRFNPTSLAESESDADVGSLVFDDAELRNPEEWLLRLDYSASKPNPVQAMQRTRLERVKNILIKILPDVEDIRFVVPAGVNPISHVEFQTPYGWVPLRQLGYGYRTMIAWMVDLASRMIERYPESPDPLAEPAVVLVDEIDLHLHPMWQRDLIAFLTERFPNTQFIATAHSPLIVQAAVGANIALLKRDGDHVIIDNDVETIRGWRIDQIYTSDLFGLPSARPPELDDLLAQQKKLLTKPTLTKADQKKLKEIESALGVLPVGETAEQAKTMALLAKALQFLNEEKALKP
jgi:predicted ATPase